MTSEEKAAPLRSIAPSSQAETTQGPVDSREIVGNVPVACITKLAVELLELSAIAIKPCRVWIDFGSSFENIPLEHSRLLEAINRVKTHKSQLASLPNEAHVEHSRLFEAINRVKTHKSQLAGLPNEAHVAFHRGPEVCAF